MEFKFRLFAESWRFEFERPLKIPGTNWLATRSMHQSLDVYIPVIFSRDTSNRGRLEEEEKKKKPRRHIPYSINNIFLRRRFARCIMHVPRLECTLEKIRAEFL